ncbi:hypothetical protein [Leucobacter ruminantium]|uniref:Lipoprotein n=1 Tax=Leucobacter ruminantium TaxID=1289170 RepID=A0A939LUW1_9MICO|nr:hypothetical protein [Leucobacter ruminantium]MBO1805225.1 hypothetical protein [Leucobacter ruminantium]
MSPVGGRRRLRAAGVAALWAMLLAGCTASAGQDRQGTWSEFGPFERFEAKAAESGQPGPIQMRLPGGVIVDLDAEELLGTGPGLPARDDYTVLSQQYSHTLDGEEPVIVGLVQTRREMHYRGYSDYEYVTFVLGVSADPSPRELTRTRILRGGKHSASFAGRSDLGVVAVLLDGELNTDSTPDSRVVGVDAVRGTEVWVKEHGYPVYGDGTARFYLAPSPKSCATEVQRYTVATGIAEKIENYPNTDAEQGGTCRTAQEEESTS